MRQPVFPELDDRWIKEGAVANVNNLRMMRQGMNKLEVNQLLGWPHFTEGYTDVRDWSYLFHFEKDRARVSCQYLVQFDRDFLTQAAHWKGPDCESFLRPVVAAPAPAPVRVVAAPVPVAPPAPVIKPRVFRLQAEGLFQYGGGQAQDLLPSGRATIQKLAAQIQGEGIGLGGMTITGHTDRIGSDAANQALSQRRAETVRELMVQGGVKAGNVRAFGMGELQPVKTCEGNTVTPQLVACLAPNRRVEIEILGIE